MIKTIVWYTLGAISLAITLPLAVPVELFARFWDKLEDFMWSGPY